MRKDFLFVVLCLGLTACVQAADEMVPVLKAEEVQLVFSASFAGADEAQTRTVLEADGKVSWSPKESIHVFNGTDKAKFTSTNTSVAATASFEGSMTLSSATPLPYFAVYPYDADDVSDGNTVTVKVPSSQRVGVANIADGMSPAVARTESSSSPLEGMDLSFFNVCSGLKFSLSHSDITAITFRGNNGEDVAGRVKVGFDGSGLPRVEQILSGENEIRFCTKDGGEFSPGSWCFLTLLPQTFSKGFTLVFETPTMVGTYVYDKEVTFQRSVWRRAAFVDMDVVFSFPDLASVAMDFVSTNAQGVIPVEIANDEYELTLSGGDPYIFTQALAEDLDPSLRVLEFEYKLSQSVDVFQLFFGINGSITEAASIKTGSLPATDVFKTFRLDITAFRDGGWGKKGEFLRFDPGQTGRGTMRVRNFVVRAMTEEEAQYGVETEEDKDKRAMGERLSAYLRTNYPSSVREVTVTTDKVTVEGVCGGGGSYVLAEITPWQDVTELSTFPYTTDLSGGSFSVTLDRIVNGREGINYDRVFSKWAVVKVEDGKQTLDSHARYADEVPIVRMPEKTMALRNKKGLGAGIKSTDFYREMDDLGLGSITTNITIEGIVGNKVSSGGTAFGGLRYSVNASGRNSLDSLIKQTYARDVIVAAIILTQSSSAYADPENTGGYYAMPNMTTAADFNHYAAALNFLVTRYSHLTAAAANKPLGRINHWIMHNEVDQGLIWTNMGNQPMERYLDRYIKSMRICYNLVRQYDPEASVMGSFTHSWTSEGGGYSPKAMLDRLVEYSEAEGDFFWGVACHPYPQVLTHPKFWAEDVEATASDNSPFVTFKNLEVIDRWIRNPKNLYKGTTKRVLYLSENGTSSPTYSDADLALQAAGACWAWKKVQALPGIDAMQWHSWKDNNTEASQGLRLGLRTLADQGYEANACKPVWYVWQAAGTENEDTVFAPYLPVIGISSWDEIMQ